jgi:hypothetical protein
MCDYSLHSVRSRPATIGDRLVTTLSLSSTTRFFAAINEPDVAVCLRPGTELVFDKDAQHGNRGAQWLPFLRNKSLGKVARFRQVNLDRTDMHHDALEFADGTVILVTRLQPGQRATVLQLAKDSSGDQTSALREQTHQLADVSLGR